MAATDGGPLAPGALDLLLPLRAGQRPAPPIGWMDGWVGWTLSLARLFTFTPKPKIFQDFPSHRIFKHMHEVLNIDGNKN